MVQEHVRDVLKPDECYGDDMARLCQGFLREGVSLNSAGPFIASATRHTTRVEMKCINVACQRETVKVLAVGILKLDGEQLEQAFLRAPSLLV